MKLRLVCERCGGAGEGYIPVLDHLTQVGELERVDCDECQGQGSYETEAPGPEDIDLLRSAARVLGICDQSHVGAKVEALIARLTLSGEAISTPVYTEPQVAAAIGSVVDEHGKPQWYDSREAFVNDILARLTGTEGADA